MIDWRHWHNEPYLIGGLIVLGWLYALATGPLRERLAPGECFPRRHAWFFYSALVVFYLAVGSPLDQAGERFLLSAHMVQHQLLIYGAAVLMLWGTPPWLAAWLTRGRVRLGMLRVIFHPIVCALIYTLTLTIWHTPGLYDYALQNKNVHVIEHLMFFGAALAYWWPILSPTPDIPRLRYAAQIIYLLAVTIALTPLFAFIAFSDNILYPTYEFAPRIIADLGPAEDQLLGAMIMKLGGMAVTLLTMGVAFYRWSEASAPDRSPRAPLVEPPGEVLRHTA